ncbi:hypothetical protein GCM10011579_035470 [Streptomyces albiflavescens]|uniref:Uncharacterized protein n=1 Tax=Streptomyces albiflavescens TaxID=1623582 RepID=A0A917Y3X0_9ACTN|nr:hypothetical protein GCM10011579_035470 [Streptomyces albiflavescens]
MKQRLLDGDGDAQGDSAGALFGACQAPVLHHQCAGGQSGVALKDVFVDVQEDADRAVAVGVGADPARSPSG